MWFQRTVISVTSDPAGVRERSKRRREGGREREGNREREGERERWRD